MDIKQHIELMTEIHNQNVEMGWWDSPRSFETFVILFNSELGEATEGLRKGIPDDHLPEYPMFQVELADFVIRIYDWLGQFEPEWVESSVRTPKIHVSYEDNAKNLAELYGCVMDAYAEYASYCKSGVVVRRSRRMAEGLFTTIQTCFQIAQDQGFDLLEIINKKLAYNRNRADHKRENRKAEGGKKF